MSTHGNSTILVVCDEVYVKGAGDLFSSATVEEKWNTSYIVRFSDNSRRLVDASDLMWLGYCGRLPGQMWPQRVDVQLLRRDEHQILRENDIRLINGAKIVPECLTIRYQGTLDRESSISSRGSVNQKQTSRSMPPVTSQQYQQTAINNRTTQARSSVLRFNHKLLEKEKSTGGLENFPSFNHKIEVPKEEKLTNLYENERTLNERYSYHQIHNRLQNDIGENNRISPLNDKLSSDASNDSFAKEQHVRALSVATPPFVGDKFYEKLSAWSAEPPLPHFQRNFATRYKERARKKESVKKCRKIFGVKNRQAWCMQCRWKKACSRFKMETRQHLSPE